MKNSQKRKEALKLLKQSFQEFERGITLFGNLANELPDKSLKKLMKKVEVVFVETEQSVANTLSNLDKKAEGIKTKTEDPLDDLPF